MDALKDVYQDLRWEESLLVAGMSLILVTSPFLNFVKVVNRDYQQDV